MIAAVINVALSHALVKKMPAPVSDPDLEISGGASHPDPQIRGARSPKKNFQPFGPHFGLKLGGGGPSGPLPWIRHCALQAIYRSFEGS